MEIRPTKFKDWLESRINAAGGVKGLAEQTGLSQQTLYSLRKMDFPKAKTAEALGITLKVRRP